MVGYLRYRAVLYWMNIVRRRESYCMNPAFFSTAETILSRDETLSLLRETIPEDILSWLQTNPAPNVRHLDFSSSVPDILCTVWNHTPCRETLRNVLLDAAHRWLAISESEGIEAAPENPLEARAEIAKCIDDGLIVPPGACSSDDEMTIFVQQAMPYR